MTSTDTYRIGPTNTDMLLPEPDRLPVHYTLISVDDHLVEPHPTCSTVAFRLRSLPTHRASSWTIVVIRSGPSTGRSSVRSG